jgi:hypothetical protein
MTPGNRSKSYNGAAVKERSITGETSAITGDFLIQRGNCIHY